VIVWYLLDAITHLGLELPWLILTLTVTVELILLCPNRRTASLGAEFVRLRPESCRFV
jgi:hypothetical protein